MANYSASYPKVANQIITYNNNIVEMLSKITSLTTTTDSSIQFQLYDESGVLRTFSMPSFNSLKSDIERLNNNINSLYGLDSTGSIIQTTNKNSYKKLITVDLNREPNAIHSLDVVDTFVARSNWFFDSLTDPMSLIEFDLTDKIEDNVRKCLVRRYMVRFLTNEAGELTEAGLSALESFNANFLNNSSILLTEFEEWHSTTPGVFNPINPKYDEDVFDIEPNKVLYDGIFSVMRIQEDRLNKKLWYVLDTLDYLIIETNSVKQLAINDELIINTSRTGTKYKVIEVSTSESNPRVRLERVEGIEAIPVGLGTLKIYSPVINNKKINISVGFNERNVVFIKPINTENHLQSRRWSLGVGFYTNNLRLISNNEDNGITMDKFYIEYVNDYGAALQDFVKKSIPLKYGVKPTPVLLNQENFKVVQINKHLTNNTDSQLIKTKYSQQLNLKSEMQQLSEAILQKTKASSYTKYKTEADRKKATIELSELTAKRENNSKLLNSISNEIITLSRDSNSIKIEPKFRIRGFWDYPEAIKTMNTRPQEIVQFKVQYRYLSKDGKTSPVEVYSKGGTNEILSDWIDYSSELRRRIYDINTDSYIWLDESTKGTDSLKINHIDIPISKNEMVEFRIKSLSEVGYPDSMIESDWSESIFIEFPDEFNDLVSESDEIISEAKKDDILLSVNNELRSMGYEAHISDTIVINNTRYDHHSSRILSGFFDDNGVSIDLFEYIKKLTDRISTLEASINRTKGSLEVVVYRNNSEHIIKNGSETTFNVECEDYLEKYEESGAPVGRVYANNIYTIKDFFIRIRNKRENSTLGLISGKSYISSNFYNTDAPQGFWVNMQDELLTSDITGKTNTQLNNQFIWLMNYDGIVNNITSKIYDNIGNEFENDNSNSIVNVLSSNSYNIGYKVDNILRLNGNNKSLLENGKWLDRNVSISSTTKFLSSIHPVIKELEYLQENNSERVKSLAYGEDIIIPINIYFKMNALDNNQSGSDYAYINLNNKKQTTKHIKKLKFYMEDESENRPFIFTLKFNLNRVKIAFKQFNDIGREIIDDFSN